MVSSLKRPAGTSLTSCSGSDESGVEAGLFRSAGHQPGVSQAPFGQWPNLYRTNVTFSAQGLGWVSCFPVSECPKHCRPKS